MAVLSAAALVGVALVPVTTRQGVDFAVSTRSLSLYAKTLDFFQRDSSYGRLARQIAGGHASAESRALAVFAWTRANIRDTPAGFPVVDDHVSHIIIRGYGEPDQKADVFTTLTMYAGVPAYFTRGGPSIPVVSFVWIDGDWRVFDVQKGVIFRNAGGALASAADLGIEAPAPGDVLRPELQMPLRRLTYRLARLVGLGRREWQRQR